VFIAQFPVIKKVQHRDLTTRLRGRPRNRRKEGRLVGGKG